jgi:hypothetical protein
MLAGASYRSLELLLGRIKSLSNEENFTTQTGNFTRTSTTYLQQEFGRDPRKQRFLNARIGRR